MKPLIAAAHASRRAASSIGLATALLTSTLGVTAPALADEPIVHDHRNGDPPVGRIQIVLKTVEILNDRDWGSGKMDFTLFLTCVATPTPCLGSQAAGLDGYERTFNASSARPTRSGCV